jgi:hypothetical protein
MSAGYSNQLPVGHKHASPGDLGGTYPGKPDAK